MSLVSLQRVAVEAIVHSASKKDRCAGILKDAVPILKNLYKSSDESIQVRALVVSFCGSGWFDCWGCGLAWVCFVWLNFVYF